MFGKIAIDNSEANDALDETGEKAKDTGGKTESSFKKIGGVAGTIAKGVVGVGAAIGGAMIAVTEGTREYRTEMGKLDTAFVANGHSSKAAKQTYSDLNSVLGDSGQAVEASQHLAKLTDNEKDLQTWTDICTGVYATFGASLPIEGLTEAANETAKTGVLTGGLTDALNWAGISEEKFQAKLDACSNEQERQKLIMDTLNGTYSKASEQYKETNKDVIEAQKANERMTDAMARVGGVLEPLVTSMKNGFASALEFVLPFAEQLISKIPSGVNGMKAGFDAFFPYLKQAWQVLWTVVQTVWNTVGKPIFGFVKDVASQLISFFQKNFPKVQAVVKDVFSIIKNLWNSVLKPVLKILGDYVKNTLLPIWKTAFDSVMKVVQTVFNGIIKLWNGSLKPILNGIINFVSGVLTGNWRKAWNGIKSIISGVISGIKTLISTWIATVKSVFSGGFNTVKKIVSTTFENIRKTVSDKIDKAKSAVKKAMDAIKKFFPLKIGKIFDNLKIPKISVSGGKAPFGIAGKGKLPSFSIKWNADGAIIDRPTIFGMSGNTLLGGGEAGKEAIAPIDTLQSYIRAAVSEKNEQVIRTLIEQNKILIDFLSAHIPSAVYLNGNALVGELVPAIDGKLSDRWDHALRGNTR